MADHLRDAPLEHVELYRRLEEVIHGLGEITVSVSKSTITFKGSRRGFAGARPTRHGVRGYLDLTRRLDVADSRIISIAPYTARLFVHQFRLRSPEDLDDEFTAWLREGYRVGQGDHLRQG